MRKLLIIEPKVGDARALKECLRGMGFADSYVIFKAGAEARQHLAGHDQDGIVILNIQSPDGEGMGFLDWLRGQAYHRDLLVVAVGERSHLRTIVEACERGAHTFLIKPIHVEDLKTLAGRYPEHWAATRE